MFLKLMMTLLHLSKNVHRRGARFSIGAVPGVKSSISGSRKARDATRTRTLAKGRKVNDSLGAT